MTRNVTKCSTYAAAVEALDVLRLLGRIVAGKHMIKALAVEGFQTETVILGGLTNPVGHQIGDIHFYPVAGAVEWQCLFGDIQQDRVIGRRIYPLKEVGAIVARRQIPHQGRWRLMDAADFEVNLHSPVK